MEKKIRHLWKCCLKYSLTVALICLLIRCLIFLSPVWREGAQCSNYSFENPMVDSIPTLWTWLQNVQHAQCSSLANKMKRIFHLSTKCQSMNIPQPLNDKIDQWVGHKEGLAQKMKYQCVTIIHNVLTFDGAIINPLRKYKPSGRGGAAKTQEYLNKVVYNKNISCDFCKFENFTAYDTFGRLTSKHSVTITNVFKLDAWNSMVLLKKHNPFSWTAEEFLDAFNLGLKWVDMVYSKDQTFIYPMITWDLMPHGGGSQIHPHFHVYMRDDQYYGKFYDWVRAAEKYKEEYDSNYFRDLLEIHEKLGLSIKYKTATVIAHIVPRLNYETVVFGDEVNEDFIMLIYIVLRAYLDDLKKFCFTMAIVFPPYDSKVPKTYPAFARIMTRGTVSDVGSDVSSIELFSIPSINVDPFDAVKILHNAVAKHLQTQNRWPQ